MEKMQLQKPFRVNWLLSIVMKCEYITVLIIIYVKQFLDFDWPMDTNNYGCQHIILISRVQKKFHIFRPAARHCEVWLFRKANINYAFTAKI